MKSGTGLIATRSVSRSVRSWLPEVSMFEVHRKGGPLATR
jgi:hypothetical protein